MPDTGVDEQALIKLAISGDADAFGELYLLHLDAIYRYIYFRVHNAQDAEDLTEQTFLKAWEALPKYKQEGHSLSSWLYRIAHNTMIDHFRRQKATVPISSSEQMIKQEEPNFLRQVIREEEVQSLIEAISKLPEIQQNVIILRFIEGLSHEAISDILDKSNGACRNLQYRALMALNQLLTDEKEAT